MSSSPELDALIAQVKGVMLAAVAVDEKELDECIRTFERADAIGWVVDPTAYRNNAKARDLVLRMMRATRTFRTKAAELAQESAEAFAQEQERTQRDKRIAESYAADPRPTVVYCAVCGHRDSEHTWQSSGGDGGRRFDPPRCTVDGCQCGRFIKGAHSWEK